ncbi:LPS-assembly protein LptD [Sphingomonas mesophila]|uniref:LPS-assembly protein LptD n=1 Tax=Sphingomonas mesophila TaxID=2303576 RepID=UPI000E57904A|nr:LPS assembly protein LptD [Sphingomonas mesophila]
MALKMLCCSALSLALAAPAAAQDQSVATEAAPAPDAREIDFSADRVSYDSAADVIVADGRVRMASDGNHLAADRVTWTRRTGEVVAEGNVVVVNPEGDKLVGERVALTDSLRDGTIENLLVVLDSGGRIAAARAVRADGLTTLDNAVYSPCPVTNAAGCPRNPSWKITAARVIQDQATGRIRFQGGRLNLFGVAIPLLPIFSIGGGSGVTGALVPDIAFSSSNGLELALPYYFRLAPNRDLTVTPHLYSKTAPAIEGKFRQLTTLGAYQLGGFVTYSRVEDPDPNDPTPTERRDLRAYVEGNGKFQLDPYWSLTGALRVASDKTVLRRYDLSRDDVLRNFLEAERIDEDSYISIAGWAFQGLRVDDRQRSIPIALPAIDARFLFDDPWLGGRFEVQGNSLAIARLDGQDTQRAFASGRWDLRRFTRMGQELTLTAFGRGDVYRTSNNDETLTPAYAGRNGWHVRGIGALAADAKWPFIGSAFGGTQRLTPRLQLVLTPPTQNLAIPNEDARSVDLEDSNLFALNRFPGHDRWEDGSRLTYGLEWTLDRPNVSIATVIGQSYRLTREPSIFPDGTGLTDRFSDIVGRTRVRFGSFVDLTHRFRFDKDSLAPRRNELDLTVGTYETYAQIGYLHLDRDIDSTFEDLRDKEELRLAGRVRFARYWSLFGSTVIDLTSRAEDPLSLADGYEPVRHRLGLAYEDECLELGLSWKRDYERIGEFRKGNTFALRLSLKGMGR